MTVVLADIDAKAAAALRDELTARAPSPSTPFAMSAIPRPCTHLAERTYRDVGPVRLLVNNAGVEQFGYLWDTPVENWNRVVDINISGVFHGVRAFLPKMIEAGTPAWVWNLSSIGGVAVVPLQAPYIMSKHAVLALTECLQLEVQHAGHDHIHVQAVLPGAVVSNIFESAGGVSEGDVQAAESQRDAMLDIKAEAMDPVAAAEVVFEQAAEGRFYLLTQPEYVGSAMAERAECPCIPAAAGAAERTSVRPGARTEPWSPSLDPDAAARVASFGEIPPMRVRGLAAVREAIESAPHPDNMPPMAHSRGLLCTPARPARSPSGSTARRRPSSPVLVYFHGGGMVMGSNHSFEPLARTLAAESNATVVAVEYRLAPETPCTRAIRRCLLPRRLGRRQRRPTWRGPTATGRRRRQRRWLAGRGRRAGGPRPRWTRDLLPGAALPRPRSRHGAPVDHRACATRRCSPSTTSATCTTSPTAVRAHRTTLTASLLTPRDLAVCRRRSS